MAEALGKSICEDDAIRANGVLDFARGRCRVIWLWGVGLVKLNSSGSISNVKGKSEGFRAGTDIKARSGKSANLRCITTSMKHMQVVKTVKILVFVVMVIEMAASRN